MSLFEYVLNHCLRTLKLRNSLLSRKLKLYYRWIKSPSVTLTPFETTLHFRKLFLKQTLYYHSICILVSSQALSSLELPLSKFCIFPLHATCGAHLIAPSVDHPNIHIKLWKCFLQKRGFRQSHVTSYSFDSNTPLTLESHKLYILQGCTNLGRQVVVAPKFCAVTPNICGPQYGT